MNRPQSELNKTTTNNSKRWRTTANASKQLIHAVEKSNEKLDIDCGTKVEPPERTTWKDPQPMDAGTRRFSEIDGTGARRSFMSSSVGLRPDCLPLAPASLPHIQPQPDGAE
jgi:hypothetical protein